MHEWDWCVPPSHSKLVRRANLLNIREVSFRKKRTQGDGTHSARKKRGLVNAMATLAQECAIPPVLVEPEYGRTVLVVEDDRFVREAVCEVLRESGFDVIAAESAAAAQTCCFFDAERVDAVLCDAMLPDGSGVELCRRLVAKKPALLVILASGYPLQLAAMLEEEFHFLGKPYSGELLMAALRFVFTNEPQTDERLRPHSIAESLQNVPG